MLLCALQKRIPILRLRPRLEVVEGDVGELTAERGASRRNTDAVDPFVDRNGMLADALADDIERDLVIAKGAAGAVREDGQGVIPREFVAREVEALAGEATGLLEDADGERANVRDSNLRERPCRRKRRGVDPFSELLFHEKKVLHEGNGRENRRADADLGYVLFHLVLAVEVRNARLPVGGADGSEDEMHAGCLRRGGGGNTLSCLGVRASGRHRHREERGRSFERLHNRSSVFERRHDERRPGVRQRLGLARVWVARDGTDLVASLKEAPRDGAALFTRRSCDDDGEFLGHVLFLSPAVRPAAASATGTTRKRPVAPR